MSQSISPNIIDSVKKGTSLDHNDIYKINYLIDDVVDTIIIFHGPNAGSLQGDALLKKLFTDEEIERINSTKINVVFSKQSIHVDDTISAVKIKILKELSTKTSFEEIYLFCEQIETLNSVSVYQSLTQNKRLELTDIRLNQFISNIVSDIDGNAFVKPPHKDVYSYDDILEMKIDNKQYIINKVIGQKFFIVENEYPFVCNPYKSESYDTFFEKTIRKSLTTLNSHLILNSGKILNNNIYLCVAKDVLTYNSNKGLSEENTVKIYFPFLKQINTLEKLIENTDKLMEMNTKYNNDKTFELFETVDMFYDIYKQRKNELEYVKKGIRFIEVVIKPDFDINIPLETIFKIIHATESNPLIKYNPSKKQDNNIYRLYADKTSRDGRKIPFLKKTSIFSLMKTIARTKSVAVYIEHKQQRHVQNLICEFNDNGYITVTSKFDAIVSEAEIDDLIDATINPIIDEIKGLLEQSGYKLNRFKSLSESNVEIKQLTYELSIELTKKFEIESFKGCISSVFINESSDFKTGIHLRFRRVSNFNKVTSQEAFIIERSRQGATGNDIVDALVDNYKDDITREEAVQMVVKIANELKVERGMRKTDINIKDNPGFSTVILLDPQTSIVTITVENINDIHYLQTIPIYLDSIIRMTQDINSTSYETSKIHKLCSSEEITDFEIDDIISPNESSASDYDSEQIDDIEDVGEQPEENVFDDETRPKTAFDLLFGEDDDEEEDDDAKSNSDLKGGQPSSDSSISSADSGSSISSADIKSSDDLDDLDDVGSISDKNMTSDEEEEEQKEEEEEQEEEEQKEEEEEQEEQKEEELEEQKEEELEEEQKEEELEEQKEEELEEELEEQKEEELEEQKEEEELEEEEEEELEEEEEEEEKEEEKPVVNKQPVIVKTKPIVRQTEDQVKTLDNMKLNKPYYFQERIEKRDPTLLILKRDTKEFNTYSRVCRSNVRRQPVILTDDELKQINKENNDFIQPEDVITYGSDPKKSYNYICPRYWCLKNNTVVNPKDLHEVRDSKGNKLLDKTGRPILEHPTCGRVLPQYEKKVIPGHYIYEFYEPPTGKPDYKRYPGLQTDAHPQKGMCLPCCFDKYNTPGRVSAKTKCLAGQDNKAKNDDITVAPKIDKDVDELVVDLAVKEPEQAIVDKDDYVKGPDKFPLNKGRWGYLPVSIQKMLREVSADCQVSSTNTDLKPNYPCLLRHGIEINNKQSFVACISDALFFAKKNWDDGVLNINKMKDRIIKSLTIDNFMKYQNGNLVSDFYNSSKTYNFDDYKDKHTDTKLYSNLKFDNETDKFFFMKVVSAFNNFVAFLKDPDSIIDHTYLWDIISTPNADLFPLGVNLVIFKIPNDDITNNVQLLCPSNHYSNEFYETIKPTIILIHEDEYYEPVYSYTSNTKNVAKFFSENDQKLSKNMKTIIKDIIKPLFSAICKPLESMPNSVPNVYKAKRPLTLLKLIEKLNKSHYEVIKLAVNYNNKVIGVLAENRTKQKGFVPCFPSAINDDFKKDVDYVFMTDATLWNTYQETVDFLSTLSTKSVGKGRDKSNIPCKPAFKIIEDEVVVGILTETNQFIQLSKPIPEIMIVSDDIPSIRNSNYIINKDANPMIQTDVAISTTNDVDKERVDYIQKIKSETNFYNVFRNTIRILLNDYDNIKIRDEIEKELSNDYTIYSNKFESIVALLKKMTHNTIQFTGDSNYYKLIDNFSTCIVSETGKCNKTNSVCAVTDGKTCSLVLPIYNAMIPDKRNDLLYYGKMSDELIRFSRIKSFMFQPQVYLSFGNIGYNLRENEIIMVQSLLTNEYFELLVPVQTNDYVHNNSRDEAQPQMSQYYDNKINLEEQLKGEQISTCETKTKSSITSGIWKRYLPSGYKEVAYEKSRICTFQIIIDLIHKKTNETHTVNYIKSVLYNEYKKLLDDYKVKLIDILILEGKKTLGDRVKSDSLSFASFIYSENYFLTTFDLWLLVNLYEIPTIFISQKYILQTRHTQHSFCGYGNKKDSFVFLIVPGFRPDNIPNFKYAISDTSDVFIPLEKIKNEEGIKEINDAIDSSVTIKDYLDSFTKQSTTVYNLKNPNQRVRIESDSIPEPEKEDEDHIVESSREIASDEILINLKTKTKQNRKAQKKSGVTKRNRQTMR